MDTNALRCRKRLAQGAKAKAGRAPGETLQRRDRRFRQQPKGTGALGRHSVLPSSPRPLVLASSCALIGAPGHPFAYAPITLAGPNESAEPANLSSAAAADRGVARDHARGDRARW